MICMVMVVTHLVLPLPFAQPTVPLHYLPLVYCQTKRLHSCRCRHPCHPLWPLKSNSLTCLAELSRFCWKGDSIATEAGFRFTPQRAERTWQKYSPCYREREWEREIKENIWKDNRSLWSRQAAQREKEGKRQVKISDICSGRSAQLRCLDLFKFDTDFPYTLEQNKCKIRNCVCGLPLF